ncbi:Phototropin-2 [Cercospora beticola]|uniref:Phototropin-2 n=1 Tax=Cercospora beticola TaxID=122368 RepID=A0A2G5IE43_CERBT|nr:Phototropin-2 [Cercospora beticola]PIB03127.1 Phototropin-2 [Cercospora beticola]WPB04414.1 hypothetical protein RHO25_009060 [Cercospora beticola]CAK1356755.1 unnamed protein product [Cercospora beticola]
MKDTHRESLARPFNIFAAFRRKGKKEKKSSADEIVISSPKLEDPRKFNGIHTRVATRNDAVRPSRPVAQQPSSTRPMSMVYSGGATRMSRESLPDQALRASISTPALPSSKPNVPTAQAVAHTERAPRKPVPAKRVDSKIGQPEESKDIKSSDSSTLDDFPLPPTQLKSPTPVEHQVKPDVKVDAKRLSSTSLPARIPTPPLSDAGSAKSRPSIQQSMREKRFSHRLSLRSAASFTQESSGDPYHILLPLKSRASESIEAPDVELPTTDDPKSFSIFRPVERTLGNGKYSLEERAEQLFSADHLRVILEDARSLSLFSAYLRVYRPTRAGLLAYYWDALKAIRAMNYARAIMQQLSEKDAPAIVTNPPSAFVDDKLSEAASEIFEELLREDLPAYVCHIYTRVVSASIERRISGALSTRLRDPSNGLAEVFVLSDPSQPGHPIVLASEEFALTTQYGLKYAIGRNSSFLQGPCTSKYSVRRMAIACAEGKDHTELVINYRRDGSPFLNLVMIAPLFNNQGTVRYWLGAQVDVSGLLRDGDYPESVPKLDTAAVLPGDSCKPGTVDNVQAIRALSVMLDANEMDTVKRNGGRLCQGYNHLHQTAHPVNHPDKADRNDAHDSDGSPKEETRQQQKTLSFSELPRQQLEGIYKHYLVVRPAPSLRILFASASLRTPGILQTHFLSRIGGNPKIKSDLEKSLRKGVAVTAKIQWLRATNRTAIVENAGRPRWVHCTPLLHHTGAVGLWVVVLVNADETSPPPVQTHSRQTSFTDRRMGLAELAQHDREILRRLDRENNTVKRPSTAM